MLSRSRSALPFFALMVLLAGLLAGCGGGGQPDGSQGNGDSQGNGGGEQQEPSKKEARETKIGVGNVVSVNSDKRRMVVLPSQEVEEAERFTVKVRKNAEITLGGQEAEMGDIAEGQQAQVEYVVKNDVNRAISMQLFETEEQPSGEENTSN